MSAVGPRVLVFGGWDDGPGYPRADQLIDAFGACGWSVDRCPVNAPYRGRAKRDLAAAPWRWPAAAARTWVAGSAGRRRLRRALAAQPPDLLLVPYPAHGYVRAARAAFAGPIVADLFMSAHDTIVEDRRLVRPAGPAAWLLRRADRVACAGADLVLLDTPTHAERLSELTSLPAARFGWVPVGAAVDQPAPVLRARPAGSPLRVLFFGTGVPLHGLDVLLAAMRRCGDRARLTLIGGGPAHRAELRRQPADHVDVGPDFVDDERLTRLLTEHDLVAGIFGTSRKAELVVPFKVVQGLAARRPVLTADTPAIRALLRPGQDLLTVPAGDPAKLAAALRQAADSPQRLVEVAEGGHRAYLERFAGPARARQLQHQLERLGNPSSIAVRHA